MGTKADVSKGLIGIEQEFCAFCRSPPQFSQQEGGEFANCECETSAAKRGFLLCSRKIPLRWEAVTAGSRFLPLGGSSCKGSCGVQQKSCLPGASVHQTSRSLWNPPLAFASSHPIARCPTGAEVRRTLDGKLIAPRRVSMYRL